MTIYPVTDKRFKQYGKIITDVDVKAFLDLSGKIPLPGSGVAYEPSFKPLENVASMKKFWNEHFFGGLETEFGYCSGLNNKLNGLEYHRSSEINVCLTDTVYILGRQQDIEKDFTYNTKKAELFSLPLGTVVELYATTLHYAPCGVKGKPFKTIVILPRGTNEPLAAKLTPETGEDKLLFAKNKWLILHPEAKTAGGFAGLQGKNITLD